MQGTGGPNGLYFSGKDLNKFLYDQVVPEGGNDVIDEAEEFGSLRRQ